MASQIGRAGVFLPARCRNDSSPRHSSGVTAGRRRETRARAASSTASCDYESPQSAVQALKASSAGLAVAGLVMATPMRAWAEDLTQLSSTQPIADTAQIVASVRRTELNERMKEFEQRTGYRLRIYTTEPGGINSNQARANWAPLGNNTLLVRFDATAPTIMAWDYIGDDYLSAMRRPFMVELQARYGNMFYVRDNGESASVVNVANTLMMCLEKEGGCRVVPGLPMDQYWFTLVLSIAGGLVFGFASRLPPAGFVQRSWIWLLLFSPLWGTLFVSFGLGPVVLRTQEWWPVAANTAAFLAIAAAFRPSPIFPQERTDADM